MNLDDYTIIYDSRPLHCRFEDGKVSDIVRIDYHYYKYHFDSTHELVMGQHKETRDCVVICRPRPKLVSQSCK